MAETNYKTCRETAQKTQRGKAATETAEYAKYAEVNGCQSMAIPVGHFRAFEAC